MIPADVQPDQQAERWDNHVSVYEAVFEPFSLQFAEVAIATLGRAPGRSVLDVGAGSGGAALMLAKCGMRVSAIDASANMIDRVRARFAVQNLPIDAQVMDGQALGFDDATFAAALSVFGVILFPDAVKGLSEMRRVVRPGGRVAVVTWTEPQAYELAAELRAAVIAVKPELPPTPLPAQLRYLEKADFSELFRAAGFENVSISVQEAWLRAPSARWLCERLAFAPGMSAQIDSLGSDAETVIARLIANLEQKFGKGEVNLAGKAFVGAATVI